VRLQGRQQGGFPRALLVSGDVASVRHHMARITEADQVIVTMNPVRVLALASRHDVMHVHTVADLSAAACTTMLLHANDFKPSSSPEFPVNQVRTAAPVMRERADFDPAMRVLARPRTEPDAAVVFFADPQDPRFQLERPPALFAPQRHRCDPFRIVLADVIAARKPSRIRRRRPPRGEQVRDLRPTLARPRTEPLASDQRRLNSHGDAALFARLCHPKSIAVTEITETK
jgi:hypothetical protein